MRENVHRQSEQSLRSPTPGDWGVVPLGTLLDHVIDFRGRTPLKLGMQWGGGEIPALSAMNVQMGGIDLSRETHYGSESLYRRWMTGGDPQQTDVLFTMEAPLGNVAQVPDARRYIISQRVVLLRFNASRMTNDFAAWQLRAADVQSQLVRWSTGTTATGIQRARLVHLPLRVPPLPEQRAIAAVLDTIDDAIQKTEQIIAKLQQVKQGLLHDLLTRGIDDNGELRDPDRHPEQFQDSPLGRIPKGWDVVALEQVASVERGQFTHRPRNDPALYGGEYPFVQTGDVSTTQGDVLDHFSQTLNSRGIAVSKEFPRNAIAVTIAANIADTAILGRPMYFPDSIVGVTVRSGDVVRFVELCIRRAKPRLEARAPQSAQKNINLQDLRPLRIVRPPRTEQEHISGVYESVTARLMMESDSLIQFKALKSGLSDDLLTGRVRTTSLPEFTA